MIEAADEKTKQEKSVFLPPDRETLKDILGGERYELWTGLCGLIEKSYEMDRIWNKGGKAWDYEYKYRRGGKTLCALYARENCLGLMIIFGAAERGKFEAVRQDFSLEVQRIYDQAETYRDGKWVMFDIKDRSLFQDVPGLLKIKRKPMK